MRGCAKGNFLSRKFPLDSFKELPDKEVLFWFWSECADLLWITEFDYFVLRKKSIGHYVPMDLDAEDADLDAGKMEFNSLP